MLAFMLVRLVAMLSGKPHKVERFFRHNAGQVLANIFNLAVAYANIIDVIADDLGLLLQYVQLTFIQQIHQRQHITFNLKRLAMPACRRIKKIQGGK